MAVLRSTLKTIAQAVQEASQTGTHRRGAHTKAARARS